MSCLISVATLNIHRYSGCDLHACHRVSVFIADTSFSSHCVPSYVLASHKRKQKKEHSLVQRWNKCFSRHAKTKTYIMAAIQQEMWVPNILPCLVKIHKNIFNTKLPLPWIKAQYYHHTPRHTLRECIKHTETWVPDLFHQELKTCDHHSQEANTHIVSIHILLIWHMPCKHMVKWLWGSAAFMSNCPSLVAVGPHRSLYLSGTKTTREAHCGSDSVICSHDLQPYQQLAGKIQIQGAGPHT
jgi:hypothetical protein